MNEYHMSVEGMQCQSVGAVTIIHLIYHIFTFVYFQIPQQRAGYHLVRVRTFPLLHGVLIWKYNGGVKR
jgi:hypothetical protein